MKFTRRDLIRTGAGAAAGIVGSQLIGRPAFAQSAPTYTPEQGAKLRVLRWSPFVQGDEDAAKKREDVAARLQPADLARAKALAAAFKPKTPDPAANDVSPPPGGWEAMKAPPRPDVKSDARPTGRPKIGAHDGEGLVNRHCGSVGPFGRERIEDIGSGDDTGIEVDRFGGNTARITLAVEPLVVSTGDARQFGEGSDA